MKDGERWKGWLRHKLGWHPMITKEYYSGTHTYHDKIDWPWFRFMKSRNTYGLEGVLIPRRFGRAYTEYDRDVDVFYIIPINLIVAFWRAASLRIKWIWPRNLQAYEHEVAKVVRRRVQDEAPKMYEAGYMFGYEMGHADGVRQELEALEARINESKNG